MKWEQFGLHPTLIKSLRSNGFHQPTQVQSECLKHIGVPRDMMISARTGEGKTLTYAIPIINSFLNNPTMEAPIALILAPTRELAIQIEKNFKLIGKELGIKSVSIVGGLAAVKQLRILIKKLPHIIVATPGRLWDLMQEHKIPILKKLNQVKYMVIDEGDRMVECGHFRELQNILDYVYYGKNEGTQKIKINTKSDENDGGPVEMEGEIFKEFIEKNNEPLKLEGINEESKKLIENAEDLLEDVDFENIEQAEEPKNDRHNRKHIKPEENKDEILSENSEENSEENFDSNSDKNSENEGLEEYKSDSENSEKSQENQEENQKENSEENSEKNPEENQGENQNENVKKSSKKKKEQKVKNQYPKQTIVCSATLIFDPKGRFQHRLSKKKIKEVAKDRLSEVFRRIGFSDKPLIINLTQKNKLPDELHEFYIHCTKEEKDLYLLYYLRETQNDSVIIFCNSITCCKRLQSLLKMLKYKVSCLHSKMEQGQRLKSMDKFRNLHNAENKTQKAVLVCTDVGARGLDVPDINHVVHYQLPKIAEIYIHRCGRTARIYKEGNTLALVGPEDEKNFKVIAQIVRKNATPKGEKEDPTTINGAKKYSINYEKLMHLKKTVETATELESKIHQQVKKQKESQWLIKMANEADIDLDPELVKEHKQALETVIEPGKRKKEQAGIKKIQKEYEHEYKKADLGKFSQSTFLSPELVAQLNQIASQQKLNPSKKTAKPKYEIKSPNKKHKKY